MKRLILLTASILMFANSLGWAADPVRLGFIYILSGRGGTHGSVSKQGAETAIDEINASGGILGRKIEAIFEDSEGNPKKGAEVAKKLILQDRVDAVIGVTSSEVAPQVAEVAAEYRTPLLITTALNPVVTGKKCNPYTFRVTGSSGQLMKTAAIVATKTGAKKWTTIGPDYALGTQSWAAFKEYLQSMGSQASFVPDSEALFAPLSNTDWSTHIAKLKSSDADGIFMTLWGGNFVDFVKQGLKEGLFDGKRTFMSVTGGIAEVMDMGAAMPKGVWFVSSYWPNANPNSLDREFTDTYAKKYKSVPGYTTQWAYTGVMAYAAAAKNAGTTDKEAVARALEGLSLQSPAGPLTIRPEDHQAVFDMIGGKTAENVSLTPRKRPYRALESPVVVPADLAAIPVAQTGCQMKSRESK